MSNQKNPRQSVLVTGAAGFIGFHLTQALLEEGYNVYGIDNFDPFYDRAIKEGNLKDLFDSSSGAKGKFEFEEMSLGELGRESLAGQPFAFVVHLAAKAGEQPSLDDPAGYLKANIDGTLSLLEFCRHRGIQHLLFGSSSSVYGEDSPVPFSEESPAARPISPYAATKRAGELLCYNYAHLYGLTVACLRLFTVYGPRQRPDLAIHKFTRLIEAGKPIPLYGDGSTERAYTHVSDIVAGILKARRWLERQPPGHFDIFNLGESATTSLKKLVEMIEESVGKKAEAAWEEMRPGDVKRTFGDISKARNMFGYSPAVPIQTGVPLFVEWFKQNMVR